MIEITQEEIIKNWNVDDTDNPLVSIRCVTYNHEPYIAQALDGFLMQKTSFPFEVIVHDDASTDKTAEIIREYEIKFPKIIKPIYETENQYSKHDGSLSRIMDSACKGKYIALCEGDDYWIDENKLQLQVDFLEKNSEYGMCYTKVRNYFQKESRFTNSWGGNAESYKEMLYRNTVPTLTVLVKREYEEKYYEEIEPQKQNWKIGDYPRWLFFSKVSKIHYINRVTGIYRVLEESASNSNDINKRLLIAHSVYDVRNFYNKKWQVMNIPPFDEDREVFRYYFGKIKRKEALSALKRISNKTAKEKILYIILRNDMLFFFYKMYRYRK